MNVYGATPYVDYSGAPSYVDYSGVPLYTTAAFLPDAGILSMPLTSTAISLQPSIPYQSAPVSYAPSPVISSEPVAYQGGPLVYSTSSLGYTSIAQPMGNLPQPTPPAGWTLSKCNTSAQTASDKCLYTYIYEFSAPISGKSNTIPDKSNIVSPDVPAGWQVQDESCIVKRVGDSKLLYKYELSYKPSDGKAKGKSASKADNA
jgi:hypothetical protein